MDQKDLASLSMDIQNNLTKMICYVRTAIMKVILASRNILRLGLYSYILNYKTSYPIFLSVYNIQLILFVKPVHLLINIFDYSSMSIFQRLYLIFMFIY